MVYRVPTGYGVDLATVLVSPTPFSAADRNSVADRAAEFGFTPVLTDAAVEDPMLARLTAPGGPDDAVSELAADISPPTDDRPFFFQMADLNTFFDGDIWHDDYVTRPVLVLAMLAATVLALAAICVVFPLLIGRRRGQVVHKRSIPFFTYFAGIGLGFLLIEVSLLQRLSIFLGHPTYGLTVVLFSMLVFSGIGSMGTERILRNDQRRIVPRTAVRPARRRARPRLRRAAHPRSDRRRDDAGSHRDGSRDPRAPRVHARHAVLDRHARGRRAPRRRRPRSSGPSTGPHRCARPSSVS